jgi:hypothetical protein
MLQELARVRLPMVKESAPEKFIHALDPSLPSMAARTLVDEALDMQVDWMQCKATFCCIACAADIRCCQVRTRCHARKERAAVR